MSKLSLEKQFISDWLGELTASLTEIITEVECCHPKTTTKIIVHVSVTIINLYTLITFTLHSYSCRNMIFLPKGHQSAPEVLQLAPATK